MNINTEFSHRRLWGPVPNYPLAKRYQNKNNEFVTIAGPCSVEDENQIDLIASFVSKNGATHLRGGVFRAGTYPGKNFGYVDLKLIQAFYLAAQNNGLKNIIEILDYSEYQMDKISEFATCFQVGCRQMQNYTLLKKLGSYKKPVFLKRHPGSTLDEWLGSAEYLLKYGCEELYLIERGSVSHLNHVRWDLSLSIIPAVQSITNIPIICDASHGTGRSDLVEPMTLAGVAAGANGILVEVHPNPSVSISDADQAIAPMNFKNLMIKVNNIRQIVKG